MKTPPEGQDPASHPRATTARALPVPPGHPQPGSPTSPSTTWPVCSDPGPGHHEPGSSTARGTPRSGGSTARAIHGCSSGHPQLSTAGLVHRQPRPRAPTQATHSPGHPQAIHSRTCPQRDPSTARLVHSHTPGRSLRPHSCPQPGSSTAGLVHSSGSPQLSTPQTSGHPQRPTDHPQPGASTTVHSRARPQPRQPTASAAPRPTIRVEPTIHSSGRPDSGCPQPSTAQLWTTRSASSTTPTIHSPDPDLPQGAEALDLAGHQAEGGCVVGASLPKTIHRLWVTLGINPLVLGSIQPVDNPVDNHAHPCG